MILFVLFLLHGLLGYAGPNVLKKHIHPIVYDALFAIEILALTGCIIFGFIQAHWIGYVLVYGAIVLTWFIFFPLTIRFDKVYDLKSAEAVLITHEDKQCLGARGIISEGWRKFYVLVISDDAFKAIKKESPFGVQVQFKALEKDGTILMTYVEPQKPGGLHCY